MKERPDVVMLPLVIMLLLLLAVAAGLVDLMDLAEVFPK